MNTTEILARVNEALNEIDHSVTPRGTLQDLAAALEADIRLKCAASSGNLNATKTIAAMLKAAAKGGRQALAYPWIDAHGRQCVCDGYRAFRLNTHLPLEERPADISSDTIDLDRIYPASVDGWKTIALPSAAEVKAFIATERAKYTGKPKNFTPLWSFGDTAPTVNAQYLLDLLAVLPDATEASWLSVVRPLYIRSERGEAMLLPIRVEGKADAEPDAEQRAAIEREAAREKANALEVREREQARIKARKAMEEDRDLAHQARLRQARCVEDFPKLESDKLRASCQRVYNAACNDEAQALLRGYRAALVENPDKAIEADQFVMLVRKMYAGSTAA